MHQQLRSDTITIAISNSNDNNSNNNSWPSDTTFAQNSASDESLTQSLSDQLRAILKIATVALQVSDHLFEYVLFCI